MKFIDKYLEEKVRIKPLGKVTTDPYESSVGQFIGESIIIDGHDSGIVVAYIDYIDWLEGDNFLND